MKLIALDMDGTTLNSHNEISEENLKAIKKAQAAGHIVMFLSGRAPVSIYEQMKRYGLDCPLGGSNGTVVIADGKLLELTSLTSSQNKQIVEVLEEENIPFRIYTNKGICVSNDWQDRLDCVLSSGVVPLEYYKNENFDRFTKQNSNENFIKYDKVEEIIENKDITKQKFFILALEPEQKQRVIDSLKKIVDTYITTSSPFNIEIMNINGNKGNGLKVMAHHFNISMEDTVAIGDQMNDIPMFKVAGLAIAMGNAEEEVKKLSDVITLTNDENGVAYAIENYILKDSKNISL
jgi:Cof subfamily protein (haloacid dehalogenase superfamily)